MPIKLGPARGILVALAISGVFLALVFACSASYAQTLRSGSQSGAVAQIINDYTGANLGSTGSAGRGTQRIEAQGTAYAPTIAPTSGCERPNSGSLSTFWATLSLGRSTPIDPCYGMEGARVYGPIFGEAFAFAYACRHDERVRQAAQDVGRPCPQDRPVATPVAALTAPASAPWAAATPTPPVSRVIERPAYCSIPGIQNSECR